jgi:hypothetical protein
MARSKFTAGTSGIHLNEKELLIREIKKTGTTVGALALTVFAVYYLIYFAVNLSHLSPSFWVGFGALLVVVGAIVALIWASTDRTTNKVGLTITFVTVGVLGAIAVLLVILRVFDSLNFGILILGFVDFAIIAALFALWRFLYVHFINQINNKS